MNDSKDPAYVNETDGIVYAAYDGNVELVTRLLERGVAVDTPSEDGCTALHEAAREGWIALVEMLLAHNANPNARNADGDTPHDYAVYRGHQQIASLLVAAGSVVREDACALQRRMDDFYDTCSTANAVKLRGQVRP